MRIEFVGDLSRMSKDIRSFAKNAAFAQVAALTRTARDIRDAEQDEIRDVFDRPTLFTQRAPFFKGATKAKPEALVGLKDDLSGGASGRAPATYLEPQIEGGRRRFKGFEEALRRAGAMPPFKFAVPGKFARLDAYGNISRGQIIQILSQLRTGTNAGFTRNLPVPGAAKYEDQNKRALKTIRSAYSRAGGQYFAVPFRRGRLQPGIYQRRGFGKLGDAAPRPVIRFVDSVQYDDRFDFFYVAQSTAERRFEANLDAALAQFARAPGA